jgi:hypothetical protein
MAKRTIKDLISMYLIIKSISLYKEMKKQAKGKIVLSEKEKEKRRRGKEERGEEKEETIYL